MGDDDLRGAGRRFRQQQTPRPYEFEITVTVDLYHTSQELYDHALQYGVRPTLENLRQPLVGIKGMDHHDSVSDPSSVGDTARGSAVVAGSLESNSQMTTPPIAPPPSRAHVAHMPLPQTRKRTGTAYVCLYRILRLWGGPEEGGWWFDQHEYAGVAVPFRCTITEEYCRADEEEREDEEYLTSLGYQVFVDEEDDSDEHVVARKLFLAYWRPTVFLPLEEVDDAWYRTAMVELKRSYGIPDEPTSHRTSTAQRQDDWVLLVDHRAGYRADIRRPRYS